MEVDNQVQESGPRNGPEEPPMGPESRPGPPQPGSSSPPPHRPKSPPHHKPHSPPPPRGPSPPPPEPSPESIQKPVDLDDVLVNELGQFGRFQLRSLCLVSIPIIMSAFMSEYIFSAASIPYRCYVPECDGNEPVYSPDWVLNAIPASGSSFANCERYTPTGVNGTANICPANIFNQNNVQECDSYVYEKTNSVVYDFGLECQEWLRALAGTLSSVGTLLVLPIVGAVSDNYGRRIALVISVFNLALVGFIRAFSTSYTMYLALQVLQTTLGAGTFSSAYVFAAELVGPKYRILASVICSSMFAVGQVVLGGVAWVVQPWRYMILAIHIPCFVIISYYWLLPESVRWLISKKKYDEAREVLEDVARVNKKEISEKSLNGLLQDPVVDEKEQQIKPNVFKVIIRSPTLLRRVCTTPIWWITATFVYYGLSINSTGLSGNMYLNFILVCAIEIPGFFLAFFLLSYIGRRLVLSSAFFGAAACNIAFAFTPTDLTTLRLALFLMGKLAISAGITTNYLFTSELYPTEYRHSLLAFSSMIGRIGSITAPMTPVLMVYWHGIPSLMFGAMGLLSGFLVLTQPETQGNSLPNTLEEAENIGKKPSKI